MAVIQSEKMKYLKYPGKEFDRVCQRHVLGKKRIETAVRRIVEDVRDNGDAAVVKYTKKFDKAAISARGMRVSESEISGAYQDISPDFVGTLKQVIENVNRFYSHQSIKPWKVRDKDGVVLGEKYEPIERVGVYVPAGTAPLISTVYMTVLPAKMAGVKEIVLVSPPTWRGTIDPHILVVANLLKVNEVYKVGGAQAIAALAFGSKNIRKVDKIVGPGNVYVTEAKRQVFGWVDVDMLAGPSEVVVIANRFSNPEFVASDLVAQAEHHEGLGILITTSKHLAKQVEDKMGKGYCVLAKNLDQAIEISNHIAPEHLHIVVKKPEALLKKVRHAGAIFLGPYSPVALGDYIAGPSHVLPTGGTARFFSGLGVHDFMKRLHFVSYSKKALERVYPALERMATIEGLEKHLASVKIRLDK